MKKPGKKVIFKNGYLIWHFTSFSSRKNWVFLAGEMCEYQMSYFWHWLSVSVFPLPPFLLCIRALFHTSIHLHDPHLWGTTFWSCLSGPPENQSSLTAQTGFADRRRAKVQKHSRVTVCVQAFQYVRINKLLLPYCKKKKKIYTYCNWMSGAVSPL